MCSLSDGDTLNLPKGWEVRKLGEVCGFQRGLTYSRKDVVDFSNNIVLRATNIDLDNSCLDFTELKYLDNAFQIKNNKKLVKGALLICLSSGSKKHLGKVALVDDNYNYAYGGFIGQIISNKETYSKYLFYNLISDRYKSYILELTDGININNLKSKDLKEFQIPLPSLPEQKRIVAILDQAFTVIAKAKTNAEQNLKNARELFQSKLQKTFDNGKLKIENGEWEEKRLGEVCEYDKKKNTQTDLPYVGLEHIESNTGKFLGSKDSFQVKSSTFYFSNRHILYGRLRPYLNKVLVPDFFGHCSTEIFPIKANKLIIRKFLFYWFITNNTVDKINATWTGTRMPRANMPAVINFSIFVPSIEKQKQIVKNLDALSTETKKLETIYQQKINDLDELKKSILQKAFNGEL